MLDLDDGFFTLVKMYDGVLTGLGGLVWHGMTNMFTNFLDIAVTDKTLDGIRLYGAYFTYVTELDTENFLAPCEYNSKILIPTRERALVDHMRFGIAVEDDEHLMIALQVYLDTGGDAEDILKVAEFYGVREQMENSIEISRTWDSEY